MDTGPRTGCASDVGVATHALSAFPNSQQSEMTFVRADAMVGIKSLPIVIDSQHDAVRGELEVDFYRVCAGMFDGIGDRFLSNAQQIFLERFGERMYFSRSFDLYLNARAIGDLTARDAKGVDEI